MTVLVYRGCPYDQQQRAKEDRSWWNLAHRPWLQLTYRGHRYRPYCTGGQLALDGSGKVG